MEAVEERICDQPVLKLLRAMLRAGVMEDGQVRRDTAGTAQGGVISPVMCNVYLHRLDRQRDEHDGVLCRHADDLVGMCWSRSQAEAALERLTACWPAWASVSRVRENRTHGSRRPGTGNRADLAKDTGVAQPAGKPAATKAPGPKASEPPRQSPTLQQV